MTCYGCINPNNACAECKPRLVGILNPKNEAPMNLIFIVTANITRTDYMCNPRKPVTDTRAVYAPTADTAEAKYQQYWDAKESDYDVSYRVDISKVAEPIQ